MATLYNQSDNLLRSHPYRGQEIYRDVRRELGELLHRLALQKGCQIEEAHLMPDHVHMLISIPPKYSAAHRHEAHCLLRNRLYILNVIEERILPEQEVKRRFVGVDQ